MDPGSVKALTFDVFGTVVDWRSSIIREGEALGRAKGSHVDWARFADAWRGLYQPMMDRVRGGAAPWTKLDDLHRMGLDRLLGEFKITGLSRGRDRSPQPRLASARSVAGHRPRADAPEARFILATLSNGNVALMVNMAKRAGLPWDAILGAEVARHYKPQPEAYLRPRSCSACARSSA